METITLHAHIGADGILTLQAPLQVTNAEVEVVIVVQPAKPEAAGAAGGRQGEKLVNEPPGEYEVREETAPPLAGLIGAAKDGFSTPEEVDRFVEGMRGEAAMSVKMKPLEELVKDLLALTPGEKAQALRVLALDLAAWPGIEKTPGVVGGEARIVRTRIPIWVLDGYRRAGWSEAQLLENYPTLRAADLVNAWAYADAHRDAIEQSQRVNAEQLRKHKEASMNVEMRPLEELVKELTPQARLELRDFAEFLWHKQKRATKQGLRQDWAGALREQREKYTSVELQHKASEWRGD